MDSRQSFKAEAAERLGITQAKVSDLMRGKWKKFNLDKDVAIDLKEEFFSRIFIFTGQRSNGGLPFFVVNIDRQWLNEIRDEEEG